MVYTKRISMLCLLSVIAAQARVTEFSRYEVILERRPFGDVEQDAVEVAAPPPVQTGPSFADTMRLVAMTISQGDIRVGFVDQAVKPPKTYFLFVGDQEDGIKVVSADYGAETVLLQKGDEQRELRMGGGAPSGGGSRAARAAAGLASGAARSGGRNGSRSSGAVRRRVVSPGRAIRMEEEKRRAEQVPALTGAVLDRHLEEYNMQAIREGAPPLPIPLTPEQDAQLVREGVLPPLEE